MGSRSRGRSSRYSKPPNLNNRETCLPGDFTAAKRRCGRRPFLRARQIIDKPFRYRRCGRQRFGCQHDVLGRIAAARLYLLVPRRERSRHGIERERQLPKSLQAAVFMSCHKTTTLCDQLTEQRFERDGSFVRARLVSDMDNVDIRDFALVRKHLERIPGHNHKPRTGRLYMLTQVNKTLTQKAQVMRTEFRRPVTAGGLMLRWIDTVNRHSPLGAGGCGNGRIVVQQQIVSEPDQRRCHCLKNLFASLRGSRLSPNSPIQGAGCSARVISEPNPATQ